MAHIILIAGTHHGGWYWDAISESLRQQGHNVFAPSLSGLEDSFDHKGVINLDTHIDDVLKIINENKLSTVTLVGWSYGGMVITGVADRTSAQIKSLIYLDAVVPMPGQAEWDLIGASLREKFTSSTRDGLKIEVPEAFLKFRPRLKPHPLATKIQPLNYSLEKFEAISKVYVHAELGFGPDEDHFLLQCYRRCFESKNWKTYTLSAGHDLATEQPEAVIEIIGKVFMKSNT